MIGCTDLAVYLSDFQPKLVSFFFFFCTRGYKRAHGWCTVAHVRIEDAGVFFIFFLFCVWCTDRIAEIQPSSYTRRGYTGGASVISYHSANLEQDSYAPKEYYEQISVSLQNAPRGFGAKCNEKKSYSVQLRKFFNYNFLIKKKNTHVLGSQVGQAIRVTQYEEEIIPGVENIA